MDNVLIAKEGYIYTNGETSGYTIYLGIYDSPDNWQEMTEEEYQIKKQEIEKMSGKYSVEHQAKEV